jgi:putative ABC transport system permease protein
VHDDLEWNGGGHTPGRAATAAADLVFGLGANTAVFSVVYAVVWKPLPYPAPDGLVALHNRFRGLPRMGTSPVDYLELREHRELFTETGVYYFLDLTRTGVDHPQKVNAIASTATSFFFC